MSRKNVLCVDFDYFFPNPMEAGDPDPNIGLYDWGHKEAPFFIEGPLWTIRAAQFEAAGLPLPQVELVPDWWRRFRFAQGVELLLCDSNAHAGNLIPTDGTLGEVWLFDAHHDGGYGATPADGMARWHSHWGELNCEDWMIDLSLEADRLVMRYPQWRSRGMDMEPEPAVPMNRAVDDLERVPVRFHTVLMCRSGAWVPPWCDPQFDELAAAFPGRTRWLHDTAHPRRFDRAAAEALAATLTGAGL